MEINYEFLKKSVDARRDVGKWLNERPYVGLSVNDVAQLVAGFDYLAEIIKNLSGQNPIDLCADQLECPTMTITTGVDVNG